MYHFMEPPPDEGSYDTNNSIDKTLNKPPPDGNLQAEECGAGTALPDGANLQRLMDINEDHVQATEDGHGRAKVAKVQQASRAYPGPPLIAPCSYIGGSGCSPPRRLLLRQAVRGTLYIHSPSQICICRRSMMHRVSTRSSSSASPPPSASHSSRTSRSPV